MEVDAMAVAKADDLVARALGAARREQLRQGLAERDKLRAVRVAKELGATQVLLARTLGVSQPAVAQMLGRQPVRAPAIREGFSSATPFEVAERYAAGLISREQMRSELGGWDYAPRELTAGQHDDVGVEDEASFDGVLRAARYGLIDDDDYEAILDAYEARAAAGQVPAAS
jgi:DNA-binding transcriptional regulator YdaS (Cro superfamily)